VCHTVKSPLKRAAHAWRRLHPARTRTLIRHSNRFFIPLTWLNGLGSTKMATLCLVLVLVLGVAGDAFELLLQGVLLGVPVPEGSGADAELGVCTAAGVRAATLWPRIGRLLLR
jgi:hypothetical protein